MLKHFKLSGSTNQLVKITDADLFWILLISGAIRLIYYSVLLTTQQVDTVSYFHYHANIFKGQTELLRTPVYPYFIKLIGLFGQKNLIDNLVSTQIFLSFLTIIVFYKTARLVFKNRVVIVAATLLYGVMLPVINFDKVVITESLSVDYMVIFVFLMASYLAEPKTQKAVVVTSSVLFAIMLRPAFIYLLPLIIFFWLLRLASYKKERKMCVAGLAASVMVVLLLIGYSNLNKRNFGFNGISVVTNNNQMTIITREGMYMNGNDAEISAAMKNNFIQSRKKVVQQDSFVNIMKTFDPERVHRFLINSIINQKKAYINHLVNVIANLDTANIFINYARHKVSPLAFKIDTIEYTVFHVPFSILFLFLSLSLALTVVQWIRQKQLPWFKIMVWLLVTGQIAVAIVGGYDEYQRLIVAAIPGLIFLVFSCIDETAIAIMRRGVMLQ